jgi:hypothetical protein
MTAKEWLALIRELSARDRAALFELCEAMAARNNGDALTERQAEHLAHLDAGDWPAWACPVSAGV